MAKEEDIAQAWQLMAERNFVAAHALFRQALEGDPLDPDALTGVAALYLKSGDIEQARDLCEMACAQAERNLPRGKRHTGWHDSVVRPYLRALYYLALTYVRQGAWALAQPALEEIIGWDITGMRGEALDLLAQVLHRIERYEEAVHAYLEAAEYFPEDYYSAGLVLMQLGKRREAERWWRRGVERRPGLASLISYYPHVIPNPRGSFANDEFARAIEYLDDQADLWDADSKAELAGFNERCAAAIGG